MVRGRLLEFVKRMTEESVNSQRSAVGNGQKKHNPTNRESEDDPLVAVCRVKKVKAIPKDWPSTADCRPPTVDYELPFHIDRIR